VLWYEKVSVERQTLSQVVFPRMIARSVAMEVKIRRFEETRKQGNGCGNCPEAAHHLNSTRNRLRQEAFWGCT